MVYRCPPPLAPLLFMQCLCQILNSIALEYVLRTSLMLRRASLSSSTTWFNRKHFLSKATKNLTNKKNGTLAVWFNVLSKIKLNENHDRATQMLPSSSESRSTALVFSAWQRNQNTEGLGHPNAWMTKHLPLLNTLIHRILNTCIDLNTLNYIYKYLQYCTSTSYICLCNSL